MNLSAGSLGSEHAIVRYEEDLDELLRRERSLILFDSCFVTVSRVGGT